VTDQEPKNNEEPLTFLQVMFSIFASAFGVQSSDNRKRDFARGKPIHFIASGILFTVIFVVGMAFLVNAVILNVT